MTQTKSLATVSPIQAVPSDPYRVLQEIAVFLSDTTFKGSPVPQRVAKYLGEEKLSWLECSASLFHPSVSEYASDPCPDNLSKMANSLKGFRDLFDSHIASQDVKNAKRRRVGYQEQEDGKKVPQKLTGPMQLIFGQYMKMVRDKGRKKAQEAWWKRIEGYFSIDRMEQYRAFIPAINAMKTKPPTTTDSTDSTDSTNQKEPLPHEPSFTSTFQEAKVNLPTDGSSVALGEGVVRAYRGLSNQLVIEVGNLVWEFPVV